jgi:hypothetical protein
VKNLYAICIKIDETLPWIELKGEYPTRTEARKAAKKFVSNVKIKIMKTSEKKKKVKQLATAKVVS